ncbi:MAG TPA: hypothetical protein VLB67_07885 [Acidimicrobiia bacterium]|nr:hypothetical protein [Acidimicrobiia bacterium]
MLFTLAQVDIGDTFRNAWTRVVELTPQIVLFLVILIVGWFVAKLIAKLVDTVLEKVGFDRWVERGGVRRAMGHTSYDASDLLSKVVFYALFLIVLQLAFGVFGDNAVSDLIEGIIAYLPNIFVAILIMVVAAYLATALREIVRGAIGGTQYGRVLASGAFAAVLVIGVFAALDQLRIAPTITTGLFYALLAVVAGSAIVAIGGGGIVPMRSRVERWLSRVESEVSRIEPPAEPRPGPTDEGGRPAANPELGGGEEFPRHP